VGTEKSRLKARNVRRSNKNATTKIAGQSKAKFEILEETDHTDPLSETEENNEQGF
jgi:hypothetical protein